MYKDGDGYKHFVSEEQFDGTIGDLIEEIIETFVNEDIRRSELGEFYNIAGRVTLEEYGDYIFNEGLDGCGILEKEVLEEDVIRITVERFFLHRIKYENKELDNGSTIKGTYTLAYS